MNTKNFANSTCIVEGKPIKISKIKGIWVRLPSITLDELPHIKQTDREYVAAEMNAFLVYWLKMVDCPILNPPGDLLLNGPLWTREQWLFKASTVGIPVKTITYDTTNVTFNENYKNILNVILIGNHCFGNDDPYLISKIKKLSKLSNTPLLSLTFSSEDSLQLLNVNSTVRNCSNDILDKIFDYFKDQQS